MYRKYKQLLRQLLESPDITGYEVVALDECKILANRLANDRKQSEYLKKLDELNTQHQKQVQELKEQFFPEKTKGGGPQ